MNRAQMGWRDLSQPSIRQPSEQPPPAPPLRVSCSPYRGRRYLRARQRTRTRGHTHPPHPCTLTHTHTHTHTHTQTEPVPCRGAPPRAEPGSGSAVPAGIPAVCGCVCACACVCVCVCARVRACGVCPGLPALPARTSDVTRSRAGDAGAAAAPTRCRGKFPPVSPRPRGASRFGDSSPLPSSPPGTKPHPDAACSPRWGSGLCFCLPPLPLPSHLPSLPSSLNFPRQPS